MKLQARRSILMLKMLSGMLLLIHLCAHEHNTSRNSITYESTPHSGLMSSKDEAFCTTNFQNKMIGSKLVHSCDAVAKWSYVNKFCQLHGNDGYDPACEEKLIRLSGNQQNAMDETVSSRLLNDMMVKNLKPDSSGFYPSNSVYDSKIATVITASRNLDLLNGSIKNSNMTVVQTSDKDSYRMHIFCLEHAAEVEKRLRGFGGVNLTLLCHPEYPKFESEAKLLAEELGFDHQWKDVQYQDASEKDQEKIRIAIEDEGSIPCNGDWAVKLGVNLYYSISLSKSPLFRKVLPYNEVIYKSFSQKLLVEQSSSLRIARRQKKIIFAGKWCGKVWMSNQVHPYLADQNLASDDEEINLNLEADSSKKNENHAILPRSKSSCYNTTDERKSDQKKTISEYIASTGNAACDTHNFSDAIIAEENCGYIGYEDIDPYTDRSESDADSEGDKQKFLPRRKLTNKNAAARMKSHEKKSAVRSSSRKHEHTCFNSSSNAKCAEENFGNVDGYHDTDTSVADIYMENDKRTFLPRKNLRNNNASANSKSHQKKKSAVRSSSLKHAHTSLDDFNHHTYLKRNFKFAGNSDGDQDTDRPEDDSDTENDGQTNLQWNLTNNNSAIRRKSDKSKSTAVCSRTRKPAHTRFKDSSDSASAEENTGNAGNQLSSVDSDSENMKKASLPRRSLSNNNATSRKRKRSKVSCSRKAAHTRPDSSAKAGYSRDDSLVKCGRSLSCLRLFLKGASRESPSMRLRKQCRNSGQVTVKTAPEKQKGNRKIKTLDSSLENEGFSCDIEGCSMSFRTKHDLALHKRNVCPEKGCGKKFFSHKYLLQHRKVHCDDRPLKCPWKGCKMTFKWAWARTEHIRVHTGERPYSCRTPGCELTFRFVRHRRKTGHG